VCNIGGSPPKVRDFFVSDTSSPALRTDAAFSSSSSTTRPILFGQAQRPLLLRVEGHSLKEASCGPYVLTIWRTCWLVCEKHHTFRHHGDMSGEGRRIALFSLLDSNWLPYDVPQQCRPAAQDPMRTSACLWALMVDQRRPQTELLFGKTETKTQCLAPLTATLYIRPEIHEN